MSRNPSKPHSIMSLWQSLPLNERVIVDYLRRLVLKTLPASCYEKMPNGVPYYYGNKRICLIWPASIKGGGIKHGVLFGFAQGNRLDDPEAYLDHGRNKRIFYKIFNSLEEIDERALVKLLNNAVELDSSGNAIRI